MKEYDSPKNWDDVAEIHFPNSDHKLSVPYVKLLSAVRILKRILMEP